MLLWITCGKFLAEYPAEGSPKTDRMQARENRKTECRVRRLYLLPFDRSKQISEQSVRAMSAQLQECRLLALQCRGQRLILIRCTFRWQRAISTLRKLGGVLLMTEEAVKSLQLKLRECCLNVKNPSSAVSQGFAGCLTSLVKTRGRVIGHCQVIALLFNPGACAIFLLA